ncbi:hypothetical protein D9M72_284470 [compost metagenome]
MLVPFHVDVEVVLPRAAARRARLEAAHRHAVLRQRRQQLVHRARLVGHRQDHRGLVAARRLGLIAADHGKARAVVRIVLDVRAHDMQVIAVGGGLAGNRGHGRVFAGHARGLGIAGHCLALQVRVVGGQPVLALRQCLRMRAHHRDALHVGRGCHQVVVHLERNLAADLQRSLQEQVERARHRALGGILDRHHAVLDRASLDGTEHLVDARAGHARHLMAEVRIQRLLGERAGGAEESHFQRLFQPAAGGHHLAPDRRHAFTQQRAGVGALHLADHLQLALRAEHRRAVLLLDLADLERQFGAAVQHRQQFAVNGVDLLAQRAQLDRQLALGFAQVAVVLLLVGRRLLARGGAVLACHFV